MSEFTTPYVVQRESEDGTWHTVRHLHDVTLAIIGIVEGDAYATNSRLRILRTRDFAILADVDGRGETPTLEEQNANLREEVRRLKIRLEAALNELDKARRRAS
jgi:predicted TIM-barrel enzyme